MTICCVVVIKSVAFEEEQIMLVKLYFRKEKCLATKLQKAQLRILASRLHFHLDVSLVYLSVN